MNLVNIALFLQMFVWFRLYNYRELPKIVEPGFYVAGAMAFLLVYLTKFSVDFFTTTILMQYIIYVVASTAIYSTKYGFSKAVSLGFLTVFLNSFWWEIFYHIYEVQIWYPVSLTVGWWLNRLIQYLRVMPFFWLREKFVLRETWVVYPVLLVSYFLTRLRFVNHVSGLFLHPLHRMICLISIIYVVMKSIELNNSKE